MQKRKVNFDMDGTLIDFSCNDENTANLATQTDGDVAQPAQRHCLNCGTALDDGVCFCPMCGQPAVTGRLGSKDVVINSLGTLTRLNKGVFYTCFNLLWRPWRVIADYIHGQRVSYTDPAKLLIGLCFILIALKAMFDLGTHEPEQITIDGESDDSILVSFLNFFATSDTLQYLVAFLPVAPVIMFANRKNKVFHYNFAECFVGALYMSDTTLIIELLCLPLLAFGLDISSYVGFAYLTVMGSVLIYKSFRHFGHSTKQRVGKVIGTILMIGLSYILFILVLATIVAIWMLIKHWDETMAQAAQ